MKTILNKTKANGPIPLAKVQKYGVQTEANNTLTEISYLRCFCPSCVNCSYLFLKQGFYYVAKLDTNSSASYCQVLELQE